ncbi:sensor histidine kinase [Clostridium sp. WILCCON 0185]|uniref:histidine kinase n=2 Tax=Candidatus Clostridium stratigraminis TaxID=3381661 RepID=A0ABW8T5X2_9CLOT
MCMDFFESGSCSYRAELTTKNNTIVNITKDFYKITGFSYSDFMGKSLADAFIILKSSLMNISNLIGKYHSYIFTKQLDAVEVDINIKNINNETKLITIIERNFSRISERFPYSSRICYDNLSAIAIFSTSDMRLLKASDMYIKYFNEDNNMENCIGKCLHELNHNLPFETLNLLNEEQNKIKKSIIIHELKLNTVKYGITYWDAAITPMFEYSKLKFLIFNCTNVTDKVLSRHQLEEQAKVISEQNELLQKTLKEKEEFFSSMSHELKTPLNVIFSALQVLDLYNSNDKTIKYSNIMKQNCYRLLRLINNLIDMSKIDSGYLTLNLGNYNIIEIIEEITLSVTDFIEAKGLSIIFDTDVEEKVISCDPDKIERIILNLLSNAIKFTNPGGEIKVNIYDKGQSINIVIEDTGIGIPEDKYTIIFDRFKQVDKSLQRNHEGSGIGLSIVKSLVEMHGGTIDIQSTLGKGSKFSILLPALVAHITPENIIRDSISSNIERIHIEFSDVYSLTE